LCYDPEYFLTVQISHGITSLENCYLSLEDNVRETMYEAKANGPGKPRHGLRHNGRFDIVLWWKGGKPRAVIEVKHPLYEPTEVFKKDIIRIRDTLVTSQRNGGTFQFGCLAFWTGADTPKRIHDSPTHRIEEKTDKLLYEAKKIAGDACKVSIRRTIHEKDEWAWAAVLLVLESENPRIAQ